MADKTALDKADRRRRLASVYINLAFLGSHVERARKTMKELKGHWDVDRMLKYSDDQLDHIEYCVKDISGERIEMTKAGNAHDLACILYLFKLTR